MSLHTYISRLCQSCALQIRNIWSIRKFITKEACDILIHAFKRSALWVTKTSHCTTTKNTKHGRARYLPKTQIWKYHSCVVHPTLATGSFQNHIYDADPCIQSSTWNRTTVHNWYDRTSQVKKISSVYKDPFILCVPRCNLKTYGERAFSVAAPKEWNALPKDIRNIVVFEDFKRRIKTHLFRLAYKT